MIRIRFPWCEDDVMSPDIDSPRGQGRQDDGMDFTFKSHMQEVQRLKLIPEQFLCDAIHTLSRPI